ncbi:MAG: bifunctional 4-hydroxy-2-oxoglutarate aldolase/2-dehydro-3-deoxy-phosphogluconate aldolase [Gammaproteobacteria bacterium]|nr:bifunctional 4-hydroxy-2-oxoglutarate aldolase/2-dehydro-3-deoxy-phosphogluconate aldolase [Gammaproteobacteria bacterium]
MLNPEKLPFTSKIVPVIVITDASYAVDLAWALLAGGVDVMEITLRHPAGLESIQKVAVQVPKMCVAAGTVTTSQECRQAFDQGARLAFSPGVSHDLLHTATTHHLPLIPGVMTPSEVMQCREQGFRLLKFFPAAQAGGIPMLQALHGPFSDTQFCPTGGIHLSNMSSYLQLANVAMVGGSWLTPLPLLIDRQWSEITRLAQEASASI